MRRKISKEIKSWNIKSELYALEGEILELTEEIERRIVMFVDRNAKLEIGAIHQKLLQIKQELNNTVKILK